MKKDIWLKPGKELNTGAIIGGIGFAIYIALAAVLLSISCPVC